MPPGISFCSVTFDNEQQLMGHEQNAQHFHAKNSFLFPINCARCIYIEHLKGARLVEDISNKAAIEPFKNSNIDNIKFRRNNRELDRIFLR